MNDLQKALSDIGSIRREMAQSTQFRGYGPATLVATSAFAGLAAAAQAIWIPDPPMHMRRYLSLWLLTAVVSVALTGWQMYRRTRRMHSGLSNEMLRMAVEQFLPALGAGLLMTIVFTYCVPGVIWIVPGLWQVVFSVGIFSSCRFLPRPMAAAGAWYLLSGLAILALGDARALAPWTMGLGFGVGQMMVAAVLYLSAQEDAR
ncbi:hypothetical protein SAMN05421770_101726 [Granulicella rosea]|uniref:Uncharacterized protein n=1 Tax=Granulicella rosea TaxID=474952 RepID=A0A239DZS0_9BACT|nr:hypothetical protein [Granulicella rosea]SNS37769.1 hypothetical protein SAMN05421770_101726 [Granulicella rosea]